jgi:hypothetical protein
MKVSFTKIPMVPENLLIRPFTIGNSMVERESKRQKTSAMAKQGDGSKFNKFDCKYRLITYLLPSSGFMEAGGRVQQKYRAPTMDVEDESEGASDGK